MADKYVRHRKTGLVLISTPPWSNDPEFEPCADAAGTPFPVDPEQPEYEAAPKATPKATKSKGKKDKPATEAELALQADASRGL